MDELLQTGNEPMPATIGHGISSFSLIHDTKLRISPGTSLASGGI
jgi:hypothetical protein